MLKGIGPIDESPITVVIDVAVIINVSVALSVVATEYTMADYNVNAKLPFPLPPITTLYGHCWMSAMAMATMTAVDSAQRCQ